MMQSKHDLNGKPGSVTCHKYERISLKIQGNSQDTVLQTVDGEKILEFYLTNFTVHCLTVHFWLVLNILNLFGTCEHSKLQSFNGQEISLKKLDRPRHPL